MKQHNICCEHEQPCKRFACVDTNNLHSRTLDEVEYYMQQGRIGERALNEYLEMWNEGPHLGYNAEWRDGAIRVTERWSSAS